MYEGFRDYVPGRLRYVIDTILSRRFGDLNQMSGMLKNLMEGNDYYCLCWDFNSYMDAQKRVDECYKDQARWNAMSILSTARSGKFSTDRTIKEYAEKIW